MSKALRIAVVGAESTGKTTLAADLARALDGALTAPGSARGASACWVPEVLRQWCDQNGRTPRADEQLGILEAQHAQIEQAAAGHGVVVCDTTGLMTAVYSQIIFDDRSLEDAAIAWHRSVDLTLLMGLDLPWVADGLQREGPHVRVPVDRCLRALLAQGGLPYTVVQGIGTERVDGALHAVRQVWSRRQAPAG
jgi:nicotinamide riboside kinase